LRRHVAADLRKTGLAAEAGKMESAFRSTLERTPPEVAHKTPPPPAPRLRDRPKFGLPPIVWVTQVPVVLKSVPWWVWAGLLCVYTAIVGTLARVRRKEKAAITILAPNALT
jgi:hypothetical protein